MDCIFSYISRMFWFEIAWTELVKISKDSKDSKDKAIAYRNV